MNNVNLPKLPVKNLLLTKPDQLYIQILDQLNYSKLKFLTVLKKLENHIATKSFTLNKNTLGIDLN